MGLVEWTATMVKGPERLGFTSCLRGTGVAELRSEEERRSSKERKLSENMLSKVATRRQTLQWTSTVQKGNTKSRNDAKE